MNYTKPALRFEDQAQRLLNRGMQVTNRQELVQRLRFVSYFRLSGYWYPFKQPNDQFAPGTSFDMIWRRYVFDRQLRLLVMDALERIEVAILRTQLVEYFTLQYGPFGYINSTNFNPSFPTSDHTRLLESIKSSTEQSKELFVDHFFGKYHKEPDLPLWMAVEVMSFGHLVTFFRGLQLRDQKELTRLLQHINK